MVGGAAYYAGRKIAQGDERESDQEERLRAMEYQQQAQMQAQQYAPPPPPAAASAQAGASMMEQLTDLKKLLDAGVLTQAEFDIQKTKILQST